MDPATLTARLEALAALVPTHGSADLEPWAVSAVGWLAGRDAARLDPDRREAVEQQLGHLRELAGSVRSRGDWSSATTFDRLAEGPLAGQLAACLDLLDFKEPA